MQQQQADGSYQELWPKNDSWSKVQTLSNYTRSLLSIASGSTPDDAFLALFVGVGKYRYKIKVCYPDGKPVVGCSITGVSAIAGKSLITDSDGICLAVSESANPTISAISQYADLDSSSVLVNSTGTITSVDIFLKEKESYVLYTSTTSLVLSHMVSTIDIGGIGGGCQGSAESDHDGVGGSSAEGRYSKGVQINSQDDNLILKLEIGASSTSSTPTKSRWEINGLNQTFLIQKNAVAGGAEGEPRKNNNNHGSPGQAGWYMFDDANFPAVGASGGGGVYLSPAYFGYLAVSSSGGNPGGGGNSGNITVWGSKDVDGEPRQDASGYGSGGGAGCSCYYSWDKASLDAKGGAGKQRCFIILFHYKK